MRGEAGWGETLRLALSFVLILCAVAPPARAHPMGNFSVGQHATLEPARDGLHLRYVLDLAEMPTYELRPSMGLAAADAMTQEHLEKLRARSSATWVGALNVTLAGRAIPLVPTGGRTALSPGAGGLPTVRLEVDARGAWPSGTGDGPYELAYRDANFEDVAGWKEVVVKPGVGAKLLSATVPATDRSAGLTVYPDERTMAPLKVREARATVRFDELRRDPRVAPPGAGAPLPAPPVAAGERPSEPAREVSATALAAAAGFMAMIAVAGLIAARRS